MQDFFSQWASSPNKLDNSALVKMLKEGAPHLFRSSNKGRAANLSTSLDLLFAKKSKGSKHVSFPQFIDIVHEFCQIVFPKEVECRGYSGKDAKLLHLMFDHIFIWNKTLFDLLSLRCQSFLSERAIIIQCLYRKAFAKQHIVVLRQRLRDKNEEKTAIHHCTKIQCMGRRFLSRTRAISLAQNKYKKLLDPETRKPYYSYNDTVTWVKPAIFGDSDCTQTFSVAGRGREFSITCSLCQEETASSNCLSCQDTLCKACIVSSHSKGNRKRHELAPIPVCNCCGYQHASRLCFVCSAERTSSTSYCDTCFHNSHGNKRQHNALWLVVPCVECQRFAARWRCESCRDNFCSTCFQILHKRGARRFHIATRLGSVYSTESVRKHREAWNNAKKKIVHKNAKGVADEELRRRGKVKAAIKIQSVWRSYTGRRHGKEFMRGVRKEEREAWRRRKEEELTQRRRHWKWKLNSYLSLAKRIHPNNASCFQFLEHID